jgi:hypothetical protein
MEPKEIFESSTLSIWRVMQEPNRGLYIPAYQRPYSWQKDTAKALLGSICEGITWLESDEAAITVLGTLIFVLDTQKSTVEPAVKDELPGSVFLVIDGQQRLSTLAVLVVLLDDKLRRGAAKLPKDDQIQRWADRTLSTIHKRLQDMVIFDRGFGSDPAYRHYPRLIRAFDDSWSTYPNDARYRSPIAAFLHAYVRHVKGASPVEKFQWEPGEGEQAKVLNSIYRLLSKQIDDLAKGEHDEEEPPLPALSAMAKDKARQERFFGSSVPDEVLSHWSEPATTKPSERIQSLSRLILLASYLLDRVAVTQVEVKKEAYAFDLFETLNTTGDPLTAYETFKPLVIKDEGLDKYKNSKSFTHLTVVDSFFESNAKRRRQASDGLLIPFALFESGKKLGKQLRDQRNWLRRSYEEAGSATGKHKFLEGMATVARFMTECWQEEEGSVSSWDAYVPPESIEDFKFCLAVLRSVKHDVTIALLSRVFERVHTASNMGQRMAAGAELTETLRAVTAFFALWRGSRDGTKNIDSVYRKLLQGQDFSPAFKRTAGPPPSAESVRVALRKALTSDKGGGISNRTEWIDRASTLDVYRQSADLTRLLLLAAGHDAVPDPTRPGLLQRAKRGVCHTLSCEAWNAGHEVEHIVPESPSNETKHKWPKEVYDDELLHTLGNLWLLPSRENKSAGNRGWPVKRVFYRALAAKTVEESESILSEANEEGYSFGKMTEVILANAQYMPHIHALAELPVDHRWDSEYVASRSRNIAALAWDTLAPWLGIETSK